MKLKKAFNYALNMVIHSKLRSWLTIIGIVIGVASVLSISAMGDALKSSVTDQLNSLGADIITVTPGFSRSMSMSDKFRGGGGDTTTNDNAELTNKDIMALKQITEIELINTQINGKVDIEYFGGEGSTGLTGVDEKVFHEITSLEVEDGRLLMLQDKNVVIIGTKLASDYFDKEINLNDMITIEGKSFRVVGIINSGSSIYMPIDYATQVIEDKEKDVYDSIQLKVKEGYDVQAVTDKIEEKLMISRHVNKDDQDFTVNNLLSFQERITETTGTMTFFLSIIAGISLLVGAVGIANTMFTSVLEKTKEIGILKAIGAKGKDIMKIFLINAAIIGGIGGMMGTIIASYVATKIPSLIGGAGPMRNLTTVGVSLEFAVAAVLISAGIGMLSGIIPAYQASKLDPVEALRYE